ncbi:MAG: hypothetical protein PHQ33_06125 [Bacteroidales bacterium]|nr:hypothetical protein [Bacteroidales bacterium]
MNRFESKKVDHRAMSHFQERKMSKPILKLSQSVENKEKKIDFF